MPPYFFWGLMFICITGGAMFLIGAAVFLYAAGRIGTRKAAALTVGVCLAIGVLCSGLVTGAVWATRCDPPEAPITKADVLGTWDEVPGGARGASITFSDAPGSGGTFEMTGISADWFGSDTTTVYSAHGTWQLRGTSDIEMNFQSFEPAERMATGYYSNALCSASPPYELRVNTFHFDRDAADQVPFHKR